MDIQILLVPYDTARPGWRSGAGPGHLLAMGLTDRLRALGHRVVGTVPIEDDSARDPAEVRTAFELMRRVAAAVRSARAARHFPLVLAGNCNVAVGVLSGLSPQPRTVFWFDAHGELNTPETTASGFLDGMGLAIALGLAWRTLAESIPGFAPVPPEAIHLLGARDLDPPEQAFLARTPIVWVPPSQIEALAKVLDRRSQHHGLGYLHLDPDCFDPELVGRGNFLPAAQGLSAPQVTAAIRAITGRLPIGAITIASFAPEYDVSGSICQALFAALETALGEQSRCTA